MRIDVAELLKSATGETRAHQIEGWELLAADGATREPVGGSATLLRTRSGVLVTADLSLRTRQPCSRCLREIDASLDLHLEEEFLPATDISTGAALPPPEDPGTFRIDAQHVMDLSEAVRQYRETAVPMQPLCRPDCAGLCPACGRDLNTGACDCPQEPIGQKWSALAELGRRMQNL